MSFEHRLRSRFIVKLVSNGLEVAHLHRLWGMHPRATLATVLSVVPAEVDREVLIGSLELVREARTDPAVRRTVNEATFSVTKDLIDRSTGLDRTFTAGWPDADPRRWSIAASHIPGAIFAWRAACDALSDLCSGAAERNEPEGGKRADPRGMFAHYLARVGDPGRAAGMTAIELAGVFGYDSRVAVTPAEREYVQTLLSEVAVQSGMALGKHADLARSAATAASRAGLAAVIGGLPEADFASWPLRAGARFPLTEARYDGTRFVVRQPQIGEHPQVGGLPPKSLSLALRRRLAPSNARPSVGATRLAVTTGPALTRRF